MNNLDLYNSVRLVPQEAQKKIGGGRLSGMTDINPMWRIKALTEQFGACGFGWKYEITKQWTEKSDNGEVAAFVNINLFIKQGDEWSSAIPGNGGSMFVANEKNGPYVSDECYKMALTDAISVSCKALGFGADVYWDKDRTKYSDKPQNDQQGNKSVGNDNHAPETIQGSKNDLGGSETATKAQVAEVFKAAAERKEKFPAFDLFKHLEEMLQARRITTKYTYADKAKTKVNWTQKDVFEIMSDLELPF
jgi:hypothetical protein